MVSRALNIGLRAFQLLCAVVVVGLTGDMVARAVSGVHAVVNYSLFVGIWWLLTLLYFLPTSFIDRFSNSLVDMIFDGLSVLFGFCAAVALPAYLHVHSCNNRAYTLTNSITNSSPDTEKNCREAQASTAFLWFGWAALVASLIFSLLNGRSSGANLRGVRRGPAMSQV